MARASWPPVFDVAVRCTNCGRSYEAPLRVRIATAGGLGSISVLDPLPTCPCSLIDSHAEDNVGTQTTPAVVSKDFDVQESRPLREWIDRLVGVSDELRRRYVTDPEFHAFVYTCAQEIVRRDQALIPMVTWFNNRLNYEIDDQAKRDLFGVAMTALEMYASGSH